MGLEEGREEMGNKKRWGKYLQGKDRKKEKKARLKPDTQELRHQRGTPWTEHSQPGDGMVPIIAFINAPYTQPLICNCLTANILQVPLGTSENRKKSERN